MFFAKNQSASPSNARLEQIERKLDFLFDCLGIDYPEDDSNEEILDLLRDGKKIAAIKAYREKTGAGLREAKEYVESLES